MNFTRSIITSAFLFLFSLSSFSQIEIGQWREHFSYRNTNCVADAGDKVYVAGELALFSYDKTEGSLEKLSKINGLSDSEIQTIAFNKSNKILIIAYKNSNIDVIKNNTVYNLSEIKRKQISHNKTINKISFYGNTAYLSCGFGIVVLNTDKIEISDTYFIGENSSYKKVNDVTIFNSNIYAATDEGLLYANLSSNLSNFENWQLQTDIPNYQFPINAILSYNEYLFFSQYNSSTNRSSIYKYKDNVWSIFSSSLKSFRSFSSTNKFLTITLSSESKVYNKNLAEISSIKPSYSFVNDEVNHWPFMDFGFADEDTTFYIADKRFGLVFGKQEELYYTYPNGPINNTTAKAKYINGKIITTNGNNKAKKWHNPIYNVFKNEEWQTYSITRDTAFNFFSIAVNPKNPKNIFIGSWGYGVFEFNSNEWTNHYHHQNSTLRPDITIPEYSYIRIPDMAFDKNNSLWILNQHVANPISVKTKDNEWESFNFNGLITNNYPNKIIVTQNNNKWILLGEAKGLLVFDDNNTPLDKNDDTFKKFSPVESNGELISNTINSIAQDKEGKIWVGTDDGIVVYYNQDNVFEDNFYADRIQLTSYGIDTSEQYLFSTDIVTDIEVDGANRKWIATKSSGVFLVSDNGKEEVHNFNKFNSPLISNSINDISINDISGEVFILTDIGIMSYRSDATKAAEEFGDVYVFPNPVRPGYSGKITVTGLADDVNVKFTDISGNAVYETKSLGGQAIWDGNTFDGRRVSSGVYLVYCTNVDGSQTFVTKFLFMN